MANERAKWDAEQAARAVSFTTSRFAGRGRYDTRRFDTLAQAEADAAGDRAAMIFAVTPEGWTIHISNGDQINPKETTMTKTYSSQSNAIRAAKAELGPEAVVGADFHLNVHDRGRFSFTAGPKPEKAPKAPKPPKAPKAPKEPGKVSARQAALDSAARGELPKAPDFSAETHKRWRPKLAELVALVEAGDIAGLKAYEINPISSSRQAMNRFRNLSVVALEARQAPEQKAA